MFEREGAESVCDVWVVWQGAPLIVRLQKEVIVTIEVGPLDCKHWTCNLVVGNVYRGAAVER